MRRLTCISGLVARLLLAAVLLGGCGGDDGGEEVLPDGPGDPRAYTERYLREHPGAVLRPTHLLVVDVVAAEGSDRFAYELAESQALRLDVEPGTDLVDALVLRDARGHEVARSGTGVVHVGRGRHQLEIRPRAGDVERQTIFVRPEDLAGGGVALTATKNCTGCCFDGAQLEGQDFDGVDLSGSFFFNANIADSTFRGAMMTNCFLSGEVEPTIINGCDFSGADLTGAHFDWTNIGQLTVFGGPVPTPPANLSNTSFGGALVEDDDYATGLLENVVFSNCPMTGAKFTGAMLLGADFRGADLSGADFTATGTLVIGGPRQTSCQPCDFSVDPSSGNPAKLENAVLTASGSAPLLVMAPSSFAGADLAGAQLQGGAYAGLDFSSADFTGAALEGTQLAGANLGSANFTDATLDGAVLDGAQLGGAVFAGASFVQASLDGVDLYEQDLHGLSFRGASLRASILDYADLAGADLAGAQLGVPAGSTMQPASLVGAYMPEVDLTGADLRGVDLTGAHLYGDATRTSLSQALLDGATLVDAICSGTEFSQASLRGAVLDGAQLVNTSFVEADLTNASLDSAYLQGADFSAAASVAGIRLTNAAVSTMAGVWTFTEQNGMPVDYAYGATDLGAIATRTDVICPDGEPGPCVGAALDPVMNGPFPPVPTCVPLPPNYNNCTAPSPPPTPTPPAP